MCLSEEDVVRAIVGQRSRLLAYIWAIVQDQSVVEDVFQEISLLAVRKRGEIQSVAAFPAWLREAARFKALAVVRDRGREERVLSEAAMLRLDEVWQASDHDRHDVYLTALQQCLERLPPHSRRIVSLRYLGGLKATEVAERLDRNVSAVYVALSRIYTRLRGCIQQQLDREEVEHV